VHGSLAHGEPLPGGHLPALELAPVPSAKREDDLVQPRQDNPDAGEAHANPATGPGEHRGREVLNPVVLALHAEHDADGKDGQLPGAR
jgi:hypothetical protein